MVKCQILTLQCWRWRSRLLPKPLCHPHQADCKSVPDPRQNFAPCHQSFQRFVCRDWWPNTQLPAPTEVFDCQTMKVILYGWVQVGVLPPHTKLCLNLAGMLSRLEPVETPFSLYQMVHLQPKNIFGTEMASPIVPHWTFLPYLSSNFARQIQK